MSTWKTVRLEDIAGINMGQSPPSSSYNRDGIGPPFYQGKAEFGAMFPLPVKWCTEPKKTALSGDVLMSVRAPVGPTNLCQEQSCIGRGLAALTASDGLSNRYLLYFLRSTESEIASLGTGTTFKAVSGKVLKDIQVPLPPVAEQKRIVAKIEELFTRLDAGGEALQKVKAQIKRYRQAVLRDAFTGKLTAKWRNEELQDPNSELNREPADKLLKRMKGMMARQGKLGLAAQADGKPPHLSSPSLPDEWLCVGVSDLGHVLTGTTPPKSKTEYYGGNFPFFKPTDLDAGYYAHRAREALSQRGKEKARVFPALSTLVTCIGATIGKTGFLRVDGAFNQQINAIIPHSGMVPEFIYFGVISPNFQKLIYETASATTLPILNKSKFMILPFPLPSRREQTQIVQEIERYFSIADAAEQAVEASLKQAERLRQSILKWAFEGKLIPQDPNDEPAAALLARIKAEKVKQ